MKKVLYSLSLVLAFLASASIASAQDQAQPQPKKNNWYVGAGAGVNMLYDNRAVSSPAFACDLFAGNWFTPAFGVRAGVHGLKCKPATDFAYWFSGEDAFNLFELNVDAMWNFTKYQPEKSWTPAFYARLSGILGSAKGNTKIFPGIGAGFYNQFHVGEKLSIYVDANAVATSEPAFRVNGYEGRFLLFPSLTVGVVYDLGVRGF
ncbi:MAG: hypothetical protein II171_03685 [Bacteroidales bacterium]|nr:hypothetical protein [Bacteroidales bacterium]